METLEKTCDDNLGIKIERRKNSITNRNLLIAAWESDLDKILECVEQGADIDFVDNDGNTLLHYAIRSKKVEDHGNTPLDDAIESKHKEVLRYLVENLKNINVENNEGKTPLDTAVALGQNYVFELLSQKNVAKSLAIIKDQDEAYQPSDDTASFMEGVFHDDYSIRLSKEDIQNILDFKYFRKDGKKLFKAIEIDAGNRIKDIIENEIAAFRNTKKTTTVIIGGTGFFWIPLVFYYTNEGNEDRFKTYICDLLPSRALPLSIFIADVISSKGIEVIHTRLNQSGSVLSEIWCFSGILALKYAEIFDPFLDEGKVLEDLRDVNAEKEKEFYANILMEKKRVEDKIAVCFETLHNLNKNERDVAELNHKNANVFINFLEAFALEDTDPKLSKTLWTQEQKDKIQEKITNLKKGYFTTYYFESNNKKQSDFTLIEKARNMILKANKIMHPRDFDCFIKDKSSVSVFFKILEKYTGQMKNKMEQKLVKIDDEIYCYEFLKSASIANQTEGDLLDIRNFLRDIYNSKDEIKQDETIFNLTVNIFPIINDKKEKVRSLSVALRNNLVHNYQEKSILNNEKKFKEIKELHSLRSDLFKFFYSQQVHGLLSEIIDKDIETLQNDFHKILDDFQKEIIKEENIIISGEPLNSFEYVYQEPLYPQRDENITLVDKYLMYAFIVETKAEVEVDCTKLTDDKKRDIFEDIMKLEKNQELTMTQYQNDREHLKQKLRTYGLDENSFDRVVGHYLDDSNKLSVESMKKRDKIVEILSSLKQMKEKYSLSNNMIMNLYEKFLELKKKGVTTSENYDSGLDEILSKSKVKKSQKKDILRTLHNFPGVETIDVMIGEEKLVDLNTFDIIRNIFVFCNSYNKYKIKCNNVEKAFNDETFLYYLFTKQNNISKLLKDKYFVCVLIKKLITIEYVSPYIAKLLYESNDDKVIDEKDFKKLLGNLIKEKAYVKHLKKLLDFKSEKFDVYGEFCDKILDNNFHIENICDILQDPNHAKSILNKLDEKVKAIRKNYLTEDEARRIVQFCGKILNKPFNFKNIDSILQDCSEVKVILRKLSENIENVKMEHPFKIKKLRKFLGNISSNTSERKEPLNHYIIEILCNLKDKVDCREVNYNKEKSIKLIENITQQILKQLNVISYDLHCNSRYDVTVQLLEASIVASKKLTQNDDLKIILLDAEFQKVKSMIQLAKMNNNRERKIRQSIKILHRIKGKIDKNPKFLLILAEIAYAERLLGRYDKSCQSYERLFEIIATTVSSNEFSKIESSKEYQNILTISDEAKKYLCITNIQISIAFNKRCLWNELLILSKNDEALNNIEGALQVLKELYSFRKKSLKNNLDAEKRTELALIALEIAKTKHEFGKYGEKNVVQHYQEALVKCIQCCEILKEIYSSFYPTYKESISLMQDIVDDVDFEDCVHSRQSTRGLSALEAGDI